MFKWAAVAAIWGIVIVGGGVGYFAYQLPDIDNLSAQSRTPSVRLLSTDGSIFATSGQVHGESLSIREMPAHLPRAVLAIEDRRFYQHFGVDPWGVIRAAVTNLTAGRVAQGGSTITQQLAKNLFLTPERSFDRKAKEMLLALWLEHKFTKDEILAIYLNRVYFGAGTYGVDAAAWRYFGHSAREVTVYQAAMLAGLLKAPSRLSPSRDRKPADDRARQVLASMVEAGFLESTAAARAAQQSTMLAMGPGGNTGSRYFADWVLDQVAGYIGYLGKDLVVTTTLEPGLQRVAEEETKAILARESGTRNASQASLVALDLDGGVRAMVGGRDYLESQFNRATQAQRQSGSAFKTFVYLAALQAGWKATDLIEDTPITVRNWSPVNIDGRYRGPVTLTQALAPSSNVATVRLSERVGRGRVIETARRLGLSGTLDNHPSLPLGVDEVNLLELTGAYGAIANGGQGVQPYGIREIRDASGTVLFRHGGSGIGPVMSPQEAASITDMLTRVIEDGTGRAARLPRPVAGKTGTSQDFRDAWFIGFSSDLVTGVWFGNDDGRPMAKVTGGTLPAMLWRGFMDRSHQGLPPRPLVAHSLVRIQQAANTGSSTGQLTRLD